MPPSLPASAGHDPDAEKTKPTGSPAARRAVFNTGAPVFEKGRPRTFAYIIESGEVHIKEDGADSKTLCVLGPGDIFGEMALIDEGPRTASAWAGTEVETFVISRHAVRGKMENLDPLLTLLIGLLVERYRVTRMHLPESIKEDRAGDLLHKIGALEKTTESRLRLWNIEEQRAVALQELRMEQDVRRGVENREFIAFLQPILTLSDRRVTGFEALIRWNHPQKGILAPYHFIPVSERTNTVHLLDRLMLREACRIGPHLAESTGNPGKGIFISVNLSGTNFASPGLVETIRDILREEKTDPRHIRLEITESALIADPEQAATILRGLKDLGLTIALDDFGTGYSSLGYLHRFPIDTIKIDRSFIAQLHTNSKSLDIVRAIVGLARTFKLSVVAEGIEHEPEVVALNGIGCDMGQGYLFGKPMSETEARAYVERAGSVGP